MNFRKVVVFMLFVAVMGCPAPDYPVLFGYDGDWHKSLTMEEGLIKAKITGRIRLPGWGDALHIQVAIEGLDTSKIVFFDSTMIISRRIVNTTNYFDDKVIFESETFGFFRYDIYKRKHRIDVVISATFDDHKFYSDMTRIEFFAYLDIVSARLRIENIFAEPKVIDVKVDKKLLVRKLRNRVPALRGNG